MVYIKFVDCYMIRQIKMTAKYSGYMVYSRDWQKNYDLSNVANINNCIATINSILIVGLSLGLSLGLTEAH